MQRTLHTFIGFQQKHRIKPIKHSDAYKRLWYVQYVCAQRQYLLKETHRQVIV